MVRVTSACLMVATLCGTSRAALHTGTFSFAGTPGATVPSPLTLSINQGGVSFDAHLAISVASGTPVSSNSGFMITPPGTGQFLGVDGAGSTTQIDGADEDFSFQLTTSNESLPPGIQLAGLSFTTIEVRDGNSGSAAGEFVLPNATWQWRHGVLGRDYPSGDPPDGGAFPPGSYTNVGGSYMKINLKVANGDQALTSFDHNWLQVPDRDPGSYAFNALAFEVQSVAIPEPSSFAFVGLALVGCVLGIKLGCKKKN